MIKVAIYCRLSEEDKNKASVLDESESIQNQKMLLTRYAFDQGWGIYRIYSDEDYSGLDADRPEFNRMLKDAEGKNFQVLLCKSQSRFTRDMEVVEKYIHNKFIEWGIRFIGITDNADTSDRGNKKSRQINGLINEWYIEDLSENVKSIFDMKRKNGQFIGSFPTYGYSKNPQNKNKLIIDEEAARIVRQIYSWYLEGYGTQRIACFLNERGVLNPTNYKKEKGMNFKNTAENYPYGLWNKTTVRRILKNEMYIGNMVQAIRKKVSYKSKKIISNPQQDWIIVPDTHEPIIDKKTFYAVQKRMERVMRSTGTGEVHLFASKLRCLDCHSNMNKTTAPNGYSYLRCKAYSGNPGKSLCTSHSIRFDRLEEIVSQRLHAHMEELCLGDRFLQRLKAEFDCENVKISLVSEIDKLEKDIDKANGYMVKAYTDKLKGLLPEELFIEVRNKCLSDKESFTKRKECLEKQLAELPGERAELEGYRGMAQRYKGFKRLDYTMVAELIDFIEIGEKDTEKGEQKVVIHWLF